MILKFRGAGSVDEYNKPRHAGVFGIPVPGTASLLSVVHAYRHLGGRFQSNLSNVLYVQDRAGLATSKYIPLAGRVLGSPWIDIKCKLLLCSALIESSLLYLAHVKVLRHSKSSILCICE